MESIKSVTNCEKNILNIELQGSLDYAAYPELKKFFQKLLADEQKKIVLDLNNVSYIDSSGIGAISSFHIKLSKAGGFIKLISASPQINKILTIAGLNKVLPTYENLEQLLKDVE